jgi:predicted HAD superfamily Cof-like phosphohydrolase
MNLLDGTAEFMRLAGQLDEPRFDEYCSDLRTLRRKLLAEEYHEYSVAEFDGDLVETVDGLLDIMVIAWGSLLAYVGEEKAKAAAAEVVRSNLDKVTGEIRRSPDGKIQKPEGWRAPDIAGVLA